MKQKTNYATINSEGKLEIRTDNATVINGVTHTQIANRTFEISGEDLLKIHALLQDKEITHLLNVRSGYSPSGHNASSVVSPDGIAPTEPKVVQVGNLYPDTEKFKNRTMGRVYSTDGPFRIRKLTPTECFRLMDVTDDDIVKIQNSGISNSR